MLLPWDFAGAAGGFPVGASLKDDGNYEEKDEEDDLDEQAAGDDFLASVHRGFGLTGRDSGA